MKKLLFSLAPAVLAFALTPAAQAIVYPNPLATSTHTMPYSGSGSFTVLFGQSFGLGPGNAIFDNLTFNSSSIGQTYYVTQAQDTDFNALVATLRNGTSEFVGYEYNVTGVNGFFQAENAFFSPLPAGNNGIDFQGFPIDNISLSFAPAGLGQIQFTISVNSAPVPEPATASLGLIGAAAWVCLRRKLKA